MNKQGLHRGESGATPPWFVLHPEDFDRFIAECASALVRRGFHTTIDADEGSATIPLAGADGSAILRLQSAMRHCAGRPVSSWSAILDAYLQATVGAGIPASLDLVAASWDDVAPRLRIAVRAPGGGAYDRLIARTVAHDTSGLPALIAIPAVDTETSFIYVGPEDLDGWGVDEDAVVERARANTRELEPVGIVTHSTPATAAAAPVYLSVEGGDYTSSAILRLDEILPGHDPALGILFIALRSAVIAHELRTGRTARDAAFALQLQAFSWRHNPDRLSNRVFWLGPAGIVGLDVRLHADQPEVLLPGVLEVALRERE